MLLIAIVSLCDFTEALSHNLLGLVKSLICIFTRIKVCIMKHYECTFHYLLFLGLILCYNFKNYNKFWRISVFLQEKYKIKVLIVFITQFPFSVYICFENYVICLLAALQLKHL